MLCRRPFKTVTNIKKKAQTRVEKWALESNDEMTRVKWQIDSSEGKKDVISNRGRVLISRGWLLGNNAAFESILHLSHITARYGDGFVAVFDEKLHGT